MITKRIIDETRQILVTPLQRSPAHNTILVGRTGYGKLPMATVVERSPKIIYCVSTNVELQPLLLNYWWPYAIPHIMRAKHYGDCSRETRFHLSEAEPESSEHIFNQWVSRESTKFHPICQERNIQFINCHVPYPFITSDN